MIGSPLPLALVWGRTEGRTGRRLAARSPSEPTVLGNLFIQKVRDRHLHLAAGTGPAEVGMRLSSRLTSQEGCENRHLLGEGDGRGVTLRDLGYLRPMGVNPPYCF